MEQQQLVHLIIAAVREYLISVNGQPEDLPVGSDTRLFGKGGLVDSLGLVTVILDLEQQLAEEHGIVITLADDRAMSQKRSPFRTVGSLADYALMLIQETRRGEP
jgi:acyl carrier protein